MKALVVLVLAGLLLVPSATAEPPAPCQPTDTSCWWAWVEDHTPLPLCDHTWIPEMERICRDIIPPP